MVKRSELCQIGWSLLAAMFSGRYENQFEYDKDGNVFVDHPASVMMPLMGWLTASRDWPPDAQFPDTAIPTCIEGLWASTTKFAGLESLVHPQPIMFSNVRGDLKISELKGWVVALCKPWHQATTSADFRLPGVSHDSAALIGVRLTGSDELTTAAIGRLDIITSERNSNRHHNGIYWNFRCDEFISFTRTPLEPWCAQSGWQNCPSDRWQHWPLRNLAPLPYEKVLMLPTVPVHIE